MASSRPMSGSWEDPEGIICISDDENDITDTSTPRKILKIEDSENGDKQIFPKNKGEESCTILNILLENPEELKLKCKPSAIREDKIFTLDMREISISSAESDDNGAYVSKGNAKRLFQYNADGTHTVHEENGTFFVNVKTSKGYRRDYVPDSEVFQLTRYYRASKWNPTFTRTIATVKGVTEKDLRPFYLVMYKWSGGVKEFVTQRHGNATKPTSSDYFRKDPEVFKAIDTMLDQGMATNKIYNQMTQSSTNTVSQTISHPKMIANRRQQNKASKDTTTATQHSEAETLIASLHKVPIINSVTFTKEQYAAVNIPSHVLDDIYRFCVLGNSVLQVDTTFELVDGLWLTDTSFQHEGLICERDSRRHPEFPGPSFWHFRKNRETYRRFAGELLIQKPELSGIKKVGHDLDKAIAKGMTDVFTDAKNVWCTQHIKERDAHQLKSLGCNERTQRRILTDIYGCQQDVLQRNGLADADEEEDFQAKLDSLQSIWESLAPGFHAWFVKNRSDKFKSCLIQSARDDLGLDGRFYTNNLELKHKLQKKHLREDEVPHEVANVSATLGKWSDEYYVEEERALRGLGKYRLAPGYDHFQVDPVKWNRWGPERQAHHLAAFRGFTPKSFDTYKKPSSAALKTTPPNKTRRANLPEAEVFVDRVSTLQSTDQTTSSTVTPLRIRKSSDKKQWEVEKSQSSSNSIGSAGPSFLNPDRISGKQYELVSRDDSKLCPKSVQRCEQCRVSFNQSDKVLVKSVGVRERTDKSGKVVRYTGNVYLHFLTKCLSDYDQKFEFSAITVPKRTLQFLPDGGAAILKAKGIQVEY